DYYCAIGRSSAVLF
nr:immunoglobulin light chain junction region [Macaca mulatta]